MRVTITKKDVELAQKEYKNKSVCHCCVVFQACKRVGINVESITLDHAYFRGNKTVVLSPSARKITYLENKDWSSMIGKKITLPKPPTKKS